MKEKQEYMYTVYQHVNKINGKMYIGITKRTPQDRWGHDGSKYKTTPHFYAAIQKYGWNNFEHNILYTNCDKKTACKLEKELIQKYKTQNKRYGYNITEGGDSPAMAESTKKLIAKRLKGNKNGLNQICSEEKRKKISDAQKGRHLTEEHKRKLSLAAQKRHTPCSDDKRETLKKNYPCMRPVYCEETNTVYPSVQECARQLNLYATVIVKVCKHKLHSTGGYHLHYHTDNAERLSTSNVE